MDKFFCASPWIESVIMLSGRVMPCCRNSVVMGNLNQDSLQNIWFSKPYQDFRNSIRQGNFPNQACEYCFKNNTYRSIEQDLESSIDETTKNNQTLHQELHRIIKLHPDQVTPDIQAFLRQQRQQTTNQKLINILTILIDLFANQPPSIVAPNRQVNLISQCNARCVMCIGRFRGEIQDPNNKMSQELIDKAFQHPNHMIDFYMTGTEFLFYPAWKQIALMLKQQNVKMALSTNGILLTLPTIQFLVDNQIFKNINISLDAATPHTFESIRVNARFDSVIQHIKLLYQYLVKKHYGCSISFSFVLMKQNYQELPLLLDLLNQIIPPTPYIKSNVMVQPLANRQISLYNDFYQAQHHSTIPTHDLINIIDSTASRVSHVGCFMFYGESIDQFIQNGYPFPPFIDRIN